MADQVAVRHIEGRIHGFLVPRDLDDNILASGGLTQPYLAERRLWSMTMSLEAIRPGRAGGAHAVG